MSNRYVWGRYNTTTVLSYNPSSYTGGNTHVAMSQDINWIVIYCAAANCVLSGSTVTFQSPNYMRFDSWSDHLDVPSNYYFALVSSDSQTTASLAATYYSGYNPGQAYIGITQVGANAALTFREYYSAQASYTQGSLQGYASAATSSAYPQDGVSGSYWYEYQGQDSIDARGCNSLLSYAPPEKSARIKPYKVSCSLSPTGMDVSISMKPPTMSSNPLFRSLMA